MVEHNALWPRLIAPPNGLRVSYGHVLSVPDDFGADDFGADDLGSKQFQPVPLYS